MNELADANDPVIASFFFSNMESVFLPMNQSIGMNDRIVPDHQPIEALADAEAEANQNASNQNQDDSALVNDQMQ